MHVLITYKLRPGVTLDRFRRWSRDVDQVILLKQPGVRRYQVLEVTARPKGEAPFDIVENIDVESREAWEKVNGYPDMVPVVKEWLELCDPDSVSVVYGSAI
jgi:hypothetical protein